ncbi:MAG: DNA-binding response regulator, partial [Aliifodinibius sp.]|nr:response regulator transcription factor [Fodinibius sp.]NIV14629.1 DNA-binding response regulator [Fodinibius sp.]NIY28489.1 DNA-binding response regulator [Fodinibius sp.]
MSNRFKKSIVLVDDHPLMRKGLALTLDSDPAYEVIEQLDRGEELIQRLDELSP